MQFDTDYVEFPVCPHCGNEHRDCPYEYFPMGIEDTSVTCEACDLDFFCSQHVDVTYSSRKPEDT